jgi:CubicO group peptidase (beta-lactamase class C family)
MQPIFEKITGEKQDVYVRNHIYNLMGLRYINYLPLVRNPEVRVAPTEKESYFRNQMICGYVHDPGAAMLGGIGGHAGVFANATDLASIMQLFLNNGTYAGQTFFDEPTRSYFTKAQYPGNKRGIGFDRPNASGGGTCDELASQKSFGHSGFTGTLAWADPENEVVFIFLSNRVYPSQDNWKLRDMGIRTQIQHVVYEIVGKN